MMDLSTRYMGMTLKHPIIPSASPLSKDLDSVRRLEDAGASAVVMFSLFEEQIIGEAEQLDHYLTYGTESFAEALSYFPGRSDYKVGPEEYLNLISQAKDAVQIPIIASLNGVSAGGWTTYARMMEQAGADGLELNVYYIPTDTSMAGAEVEQMYVDVLRDVRQNVTIPLAVKLGPYFSSLSHMARRLAESGADALVLFNRFYQPDFDLANLEVKPSLDLSSSLEIRLPLTWAAILYGRVPVDLAVTTGVHSHEDVLKAVMAGASVTQVASELLAHGPERIGEVVAAMKAWMEECEYESVTQMRGSMSQLRVAEPAAFLRANYQKTLGSYGDDPTGQIL